MKFQSGILGVIVVVIALTGTIFGGFILNVNQEFTSATDYTDVTDVTSLYRFDSQPDYLDYNPAKNFTGYKLSNNTGSGISYTQSSTMNQYYMGTNSSYTTSYDLTSMYTVGGHPISFGDYYVYNVSGNTFDAMYKTEYGEPSYVRLSSLLPYLKTQAPAGTTSLTINIPDYSGVNLAFQYGYSPSGRIDINGDQYSGLGSYYMNGYVPSSNPASPSWTGWTFFRNNQISINWDIDSSIVSVNYGGVFQREWTVDSVMRLMESTNERVSANWVASGQASSPSFGTYPYYSSNNTIEVVYNYNPVYYYMNPSQGVSINNTSSVVTTNWTNDKTNGIVSLVFGNDGNVRSNVVTTSIGDRIEITTDGSTNTIKVNSQTAHSIGSWEHFLLNINGKEGKVTAVPIIDFINYQSFTTADYVYEVGTIQQSPFTSLRWSGTDSSYTFSVYNTNVQMTTKLLMVNPSLDIKDYFPLEEGFKIGMDSFTVIGDSMTINGVTYYGDSDGNPISDTGNIFIPSADDYGVSIKLDSIYIIEDAIDNHTYIQSGEYGSVRYDLGETTSSVISASGTWFFTNELWEGDIVLKSVYKWDWANNLTSTQSIIIWLGLIVIGSLIARRFFDFGALDLAIVVASSIILYSILGVF